MIEQCDAYNVIYHVTGEEAVGVPVTLVQCRDEDNNAILLSPIVTQTNANGEYHFTLPRRATAYIKARATTLDTCGGSAMRVPDAASGKLTPIE